MISTAIRMILSVLCLAAIEAPALRAAQLSPVPFRLALIEGPTGPRVQVLPVVHGPNGQEAAFMTMPDTAQPNCFAHSINCGETVSGMIDSTGCKFDNAPNYYTEYLLIGAAGDKGTVEMSATFKPLLVLVDEDVNTVTYDMSPGPSTSSISFTLPANGRYYIVATSADYVPSGTFMLKLTCMSAACQSPFLLNGPYDTTVDAGQSALFSVAAAGAKPLTFQWHQLTGSRDDVAGTNSSSYQTPPLTAAATYYVQITNSCGFIKSPTVTATVRGARSSRRRSTKH